MGFMEKQFKELSTKEIKKLSDSVKIEYQLEALEYYGNIKGQLDKFEERKKYHNMLLAIARANSIKIQKLNELAWPKDVRNCIFSVNHSNANDFLVLGAVIKKHFFIMADFTMINDPLVDYLNRLNGCIYLDRLSKKSGQNAIQQAVDGVKQGYNMVIFPEGTWNLFKDKLMLPRKWGDIVVAQQTKRPIVPIGMVYNSGKCFVKFGEPFFVDQNDDIKQASDEMGRVMEKLRRDIIASEKYQVLHREISYEEWLIKTIKSYKHFDVAYEMSTMRKDSTINEDELKIILEVGAKVHSPDDIKKRLENAKVNYRLEK